MKNMLIKVFVALLIISGPHDLLAMHIHGGSGEHHEPNVKERESACQTIVIARR